MPDGCRLAARIWLPAGAASEPVPAIVEYIPYRKRDRTRRRDEPMHRTFAANGYAAVRIDLRGSGESDGLLRDEYLEQEQEDGLAAIRWIAAQPWCSGAVGMMGKSWGGFNALQVAARRPPELKAIITVCSTDDRYADDAHYMGGCLLNENLIWGSVLLTLNAQAPDPALVGPRWRAMWLERLEQSPLFPEVWLSHQRRDDYWKHGSVCEDFDAIRCPVYAISGWADGYTNAVPRLLAGLRAPRRGLVGPWAHVYPHDGEPGPAIDFLSEALRWWDHWLRGMDSGLADEPMLRVWMQESVRPKPHYEQRPGRWVAEPEWPAPSIRPRRFRLNSRSLDPQPRPEQRLDFCSPQSVGLAAGSWCGFGVEGELPDDQRADDGKSLCFDSDPLGEPLEILGAPVAILELAADRRSGLVAVRLNDLAPDGASTRVSYGLLNLTHRDSHEHPEPLEPGRRYRVRVQLNDIAHAFPAGHRIRLAISTSYWPMAWPAPEPTTLSLFTGASQLELPERPPQPVDARLRPFEPPTVQTPDSDEELGEIERKVIRDVAAGSIEYLVASGFDADGWIALRRLESIDLAYGHAIRQRFWIQDDDPLAARAELRHSLITQRGDWSVRIETSACLTANRERFRLEATLEAFEGEQQVFSRRWDRAVPRDLV